MKINNKNFKINDGKIYVTMALLLCLFFILVIFIFTKNIFAVDDQMIPNVIVDKFYCNQNPINLKDVIEQNTTDEIQEQMTVEEIDMEYNTRYKMNNELANGTVQVLEEGRVGKKNAVIIKRYKNDELIAEEQVAENIIKAPVERVVEIGTGNTYGNLAINEGDTAYVVSNSVAVRLNANPNSEKICTLNKNESSKVIQVGEEWCYISADGIQGYVPKNCITSKNPNVSNTVEENQYTKQQLLSRLAVDMDLRQPSGLTLEQFKKVLSNDKNDKNGVFASNAEYFYYIEKQYGINGVFVASVGIHESGWGTSAISKAKKNLFGYGAVDSNPSGGAYNFNSYSEGIDMLARVFVKYYINSPGTQIYDGTQTSGKFYSGPTLSDINKKYASDKNWANSVFKWMQYLYNKL